MSVVWVGGQRFAAGLEWQRTEVKGGAARRLARQRRRPWKVDVAGQSGFLDDVEGPKGTKPLAGALSAFLRLRPKGIENWIAFIQADPDEDGGGPEPRIAVVRCLSGSLLADGDRVFASARDAVEALGDAAAGDVTVLATPALGEHFPNALAVESQALLQAAAEVDALAEVKLGASRRKMAWWSAAAALVAVAAAVSWTEGEAIAVRFGLIEEKKVEERPRVRVVLETERFLAHCLDELSRREQWLAGFDRVSIHCHSSFRPGKSGAPKRLKGRAALEVRWVLRERLPSRVYGRLAEQLLDEWYWAGVTDAGAAYAVSPLPQVFAEAGKRIDRERPPLFRARMDGMFSLRGFTVEYDWKKKVEAVLTTERPLAQAVSMIRSAKGLEVMSAAYEGGRWRFEARRRKARSMFEDEFRKLAEPLAAAGSEREIAA